MNALPPRLDIDQLLAQIVERARQIIPFDNGGIALYDDERGVLVPHVYHTPAPATPPPGPIRLGEGIIGHVAVTRQPLLVRDVRREPVYIKYDPRTRAELAVPLLLEDHLLGVFNVESVRRNAFDRNHLLILCALADQAALVVHMAQLYVTLSDQYAQLSKTNRELAIHEAVSLLSATDAPLDDILPTMCQHLAAMLDTDACTITIWDREAQQPRRLAAYGIDMQAYLSTTRPVTGRPSLTEQVVASGKPIIINNAQALPDPPTSLITHFGAQALLAAPLVARGRPLGAVMLIYLVPGKDFVLDDIDRLSPLSDQVALAIDNNLLLQDTRARLAETSLLLEAAAIAASPLEIADILARTLNLARSILGVEKGAFLLHDAETDVLAVRYDACFGFPLPTDELRVPVNTPDSHVAAAFAAGSPLLVNEVAALRADATFIGRANLRNLLCVPLRVQDHTLGVLLVANRFRGPFSRNEAELLTGMSNHIAAALRNADLLNATRARLRETEALQRVAAITSAMLDLDEMLKRAVRETADLLGADAAMLLTPEQSGRFLTLHRPSLLGFERAVPQLLWPLDGYGHIVHVYHTGQPFCSNDAIGDPILESSQVFGLRVRSVITLPLNVHDRTLGVLSLFNRREGDFDDGHVTLTRAIASQIAVSMESAQLFAAERQRADLMGLINQISQEISAVLDEADLLHKTADGIRRWLGYEAVYIYLFDAGMDVVRLVASAAVAPNLLLPEGYLQPVERGVVGRAIRTGETQSVPDVREDADYIAPDQLAPLASCLTVPLRSGDRVFGALDVGSTRIGSFNTTDQLALQTLAAQVATAIENARLYWQAQRQARDQSFLRNATDAFSRTVVMHDLLPQITRTAAAIFDATHVAVALMDGELLQPRVCYPPDSPHPPLLLDRLADPIQASPAVWKALHQSRTLILTPGPVADETTRELMALLPTHVDVHLLTPIFQRNVIVGIIEILTDPARVFDAEDITLLETLAHQAGVAVENVRLIEELEQQTVELVEANRLKSEFLASISHELRTPMNAIIGFSETLLTGVYGELDRRISDRIQRILRNGRNLLALIDDLLDIAKIEAGKLELTLESVALADELYAALDMIEGQLVAKGLELRLDVPSNLPPVHADAVRLRQIINNLLSNAVKFTQQGHVAIRAWAEDGQRVWCAVSDTGIGIAPQDQKIIFDEFRQVDGTSTRAYGGTGLGLAITRKLLHMMSGEVTVESTPGVGSTFTFWLPAGQSATPPPSEHETPVRE